MNEAHEFFGLIADEEKAGLAAAISAKLQAIQDNDDGPIRARLFAKMLQIAGAELAAELDGPHVTAEQLRQLADRIDKVN